MLGKLTQKICLFLTAVILIGIGFCGGSKIQEKEQAVEESNFEDVQSIAVVNLDEGVSVNNQKINYSAKMVEYPNNLYKTASLEEARKGILNGSFAAYIIIPSDFSTSIESLNSTFDKAEIEYSINPNLSDETELSVQSSLNDFAQNLNFNISYVYVSAVLNEFHDAQDSTTTVLKNDNNELANVNSVDSDKLVVRMEPYELGYIENNIEELDFAELYKNNTELGTKVGVDINDNLTLGKKDYEKVQEGNSAVTLSAANLRNDLTAYNPLIDQNGQQFLNQSEANLLAQIHDYTNEVDENTAKLDTAMRNEMAKFTEQLVADQLNEKKVVWDDEVDVKLSDIRGAYQILVNKKISDVTLNNELSANLQMGAIKNDIIAQVNTQLASISGNTIQINPNTITATNISFGSGSGLILPDSDIVLSDQTVSSNAVKKAISGNTISDSYYDAIDDVIKVSDTTAIRTIIKEQFKEAVTDENKRQLAIISNSDKIFFDKMKIYERELEKFDPFIYVKEEEINTTVDGINKNIVKVQESQRDKDQEYKDYVEEVYKSTEENTDTIQTASETAQDKTAENIVNAMQDLKDSRTEINQENVDLLQEFAQKLSYTRVGSLGNTEAYDFIVSPLVYQENAKEVTIKEIAFNYEKYILYGIIGLLLLTAGLLIVNVKTARAANTTTGQETDKETDKKTKKKVNNTSGSYYRKFQKGGVRNES